MKKNKREIKKENNKNELKREKLKEFEEETIREYAKMLLEVEEKAEEEEREKERLVKALQASILLFIGVYSQKEVTYSQIDQRALKREISSLIEPHIGRQYGFVTNIIKDAAIKSQKKGNYILEKYFNKKNNFTRLTEKDLDFLVRKQINGLNYSQRLAVHGIKLRNEITDIIVDSILRKKSIEEITAELEKRCNINAGRAKTIARTESSRVWGEIYDNIMIESSVFEGVEFCAILDERTSEICNSLNGLIYDINGDYPRPPLHPNCRSFLRYKPKAEHFIKQEDMIKIETYEKLTK